jgi:peptidyl-prolyl cis-trans isomerase C
MRALRRGLLVLSALALVTWAGSTARADTDPGAAIVAKVGSATVTRAALERMIGTVPPFQLRTLGATPDEIRRNFLERVVVRELLLAQGAKDRKLDERDDVKDRLRSLYRGALLAALRDEAAADELTDADVKTYYERNRDRFNAPARIALWRILVASREEASAILAELKKDLTPKHWNDLARDKSLDKATSMRGGSLGFVGPDGTTAEPGVRVDPILLVAASRVADGELVAEPVQEGPRWAVVWRRQSTKPVQRALGEESTSIRQLLTHERAAEKIKSTLVGLRKSSLRDVNADLVDQIEIKPEGDLKPKSRPGVLPTSRRPAGPPKPQSSAPVLR